MHESADCRITSGGGGRTRDTRLMNALQSVVTPQSDSSLHQPPDSGCINGCTGDAELARVVAAWPALPGPLKAAVLALVDANR
jgi:hypothetical protein